MDHTSDEGSIDSFALPLMAATSKLGVTIDPEAMPIVLRQVIKDVGDAPARHRAELIESRLKGEAYAKYLKAPGGQAAGQGQGQAGQGRAPGVNPFKAACDALKAKYGGGQ